MTEMVKEMKEKKFYLIYQITNNVNGKIYIGKHKTSNLDDDYFGSGKYLNLAKEKYGLENFTKTILFYCANEEEMNLLEYCVVTKEFCERDDTYNLNVGGDGGWDYVNLSSDFAVGSDRRKEIFHSPGGKACQQKYRDEFGSFTSYVLQNMDPQKREELRQFHSQQAKENPLWDWTGRKHKPETIQKMRDHSPHLSGENNSAFGKHWYKDPISLSCQLLNEDEVPDGWVPGRYQDPTTFVSGNEGKVLLRKVDLSEQGYFAPDIAQELIESGEWEHKAFPMSEEGRKNICKAAKSRNYDYLKGLEPDNKGKFKYVNVVSNKIKYFNLNEDIPADFVIALDHVICCYRKEDGKRLYIYKGNPIPDGYETFQKPEVVSKSQSKAIEKKLRYIQETQEMADYFTLYGYEATKKKFPGRSGTCSPEAMIMRFVNARRRYGVKFESQIGKKRTFLPPPED